MKQKSIYMLMTIVCSYKHLPQKLQEEKTTFAILGSRAAQTVTQGKILTSKHISTFPIPCIQTGEKQFYPSKSLKQQV